MGHLNQSGVLYTETFCSVVRKASLHKIRDQSAGTIVIQQLYSILRGTLLVEKSESFKAVITHHTGDGYRFRKLSSKLHAVFGLMLGISDEEFDQPNSKKFEDIITTKLDSRLLGYALANYRFKQLLSAANLDSNLYIYDWNCCVPDELKIRLKNSNNGSYIVVAIPVVTSVKELRGQRKLEGEALTWSVKRVLSLT